MYIKTKDGTNHHIELYGNGTPIILLHGNHQSSQIFMRQIHLLSSDFRVISVDARGHGSSEHGSLPLSLDLLAEDIIEIAHQLSLSRFGIIGFSDGANIALKVGMKAPDRITGLFLISPNYNEKGLKARFRVPLKSLIRLLTPFKMLFLIGRFQEKLNLMMEKLTLDKTALTMPILIVSGRRDIIHAHHHESLANQLANATYTQLKHMGHFSLPSGELNERLYDFFMSIISP
ncbi:MAG: hypothetical protein BGO41_10305 [Clostridiales bacterium 38-18]|nr:MAG: hypothetical protein BGO41_10305 [Clostridiales bacterium 38-18]